MEIVDAALPDGLARLRAEWEGLLDSSPRATIYQTWEWNDAWWRAWARGKRLRLIEIRSQGELVGLAPLYVSSHFHTSLRRAAFLGTGSSDYLDLLARADFEPEVYSAFLDYLARAPGFDLADLQQIRAGSELLSCGGPGEPSLRAQETCPYLPLPPTWEELAGLLGKKLRANLGYHERLLQRSFGDVRIGLACPGSLEETMSGLFTLHQQRWKARMLPGVLRGHRVRSFHADVARRFQERDWLRLHRIALDGRTVSVLYCFQFRRRCYYYLGGFAPELAKYSLGTLLTARAIRRAIEDGASEFDFLRGAETYKYRWNPQERVNYRMLIARPESVRGRAMLAVNRIERAVERKAKVVVERWGRGR